MSEAISNSDDVIDSRDVIKRIAELESNEDTSPETLDELETLRKLADEGADYAPDWEYGETLIRDSYFVRYVRDMLEDCGDLYKGLRSYVEIDWNATARNVRVDYTSIDFDGVTYWIR